MRFLKAETLSDSLPEPPVSNQDPGSRKLKISVEKDPKTYMLEYQYDTLEKLLKLYFISQLYF